jgi:ADP-ribose pyrophosphatase YjhB (NUDIX family)
MTTPDHEGHPDSGGREYPERPVASVHAAVARGDRVLVIRRAFPPGVGWWSLPGGVIELGETLHEAVRREVREECGVEIEPGPVLDVVDAILRDDDGRIRFHFVVTYVGARYISGEPHAASDAADARWAAGDDLDALDMHPRVRRAALRVLVET